MKWYCDLCSIQNICDVPRETNFFGVILLADKDHASINPSCAWRKIRVSLLHPPPGDNLSRANPDPFPRALHSRINEERPPKPL